MKLNRFLIGLAALMSIICFITTAGYSTASNQASARVLTVIGALDDYPIFYADQEGRPSGLAVDLLDEFAKINGIKLDYELYPLNQVDREFLDHGDMKYVSVEFNDKTYSNHTTPFYHKNYVLLSNKTTFNSSLSVDDVLNSIVTSKKTTTAIGVKKNHGMTDFLSSKYSVHFKDFNSTKGLLEELETEKIAYALIPDGLAGRLIKENNLKSIKSYPKALYIEEVAFSLSKNNLDLLYDLNLFINGLKTDNRLTELANKWFNIKINKTVISPNLIYFNIIAASFITILLILAYKNQDMRKIIQHKTQEIFEQTRINEKLYAELLEKEQFKNRYFINLSHELKTPISLILNANQMQSYHCNNTLKDVGITKCQKYSGVIRSNGYQLLRIISNLIDINRLEAKDYKLRLEPINLSAFINNLVSDLDKSELFSSKKIDVISPPKSLVVDADSYELARIFLNLITNSIKFNDNDPMITLHISYKDDCAIIHYRDNSRGLSELQIPDLLKNFYFKSSLTVNKEEGSGLGLSLVRELILLHGGELLIRKDNGIFEYQIKLPCRYDESLDSINRKSPELDLNQLIRMEFADIKAKIK